LFTSTGNKEHRANICEMSSQHNRFHQIVNLRKRARRI
jgi:hypothetical protein